MSIVSSIQEPGVAKGDSMCVKLVNAGYHKYVVDIPLDSSTFIQIIYIFQVVSFIESLRMVAFTGCLSICRPSMQ